MKLTAEFGLTKSFTGNLSVTSSPQKRSMITHLQSLLKVQIDKRELAQNQLLQYRQRCLLIERQFRRILDKCDNNLANLNGQTYSQEIWLKFVGQIEKFNTNSEKILEKRCNEIACMMDRRIHQILEKTDLQVQKNKKLSEEQYKSVKVQIKEALNLAKQIQFQNQELKRVNKDLLFKLNILREERNLLIEELSQKKILIIKLAKACSDMSRQNSLSLPITKKISQFGVKKNIITEDNNSITKETSLLPSKFIEEQSTYRTIDKAENKGRVNSVAKGRKGDSLVRTQYHIKICLDRQRKKNYDLKTLVCKLQLKYKQLNQLLDRSSKQIKGQYKSEQNYKNMQKLIQVIKLKLIPFSSQEQAGISESELQNLIQL